MKKRACVIVFLFIMMAGFSGCTEKERYDIQPEYEALIFSQEAEDATYMLGQQYYQEKVILLAGTVEG